MKYLTYMILEKLNLINENFENVNPYFYQLINSMDQSICFLEPNHITLFNLLLSMIIIYCVYQKNIKLQYLIILIFMRSILDCLDGGIARKCDKTSTEGKYLDLIGDIIFTILLFVVLYVNIKKEYRWIKKIIPFIILIILYIGCDGMVNNYRLLKSDLGIIIYENSIITTMLGVLSVYYLTK